MIDEWTISRLWEEIELLKSRVKELETERKITEEKARQDELERLDREDGQWYREANGLG